MREIFTTKERRVLETVNKHLEDRIYVVGDRITLADITLANAMAFNPNLRIFSANGYYDFATPFYATVYTLNHLTVPQQLEQNISYGFYESGHMVYLHTSALSQFHDDLERWYAATLAGR